MSTVSILLADDQRLVRESWFVVLGTEPGFDIAGIACNGEEAIDMAGQLHPDIVLVNINMLPVNGFDVTRGVRKSSPQSKIIGISLKSSPPIAKRMFELGAAGYLTKNNSRLELIKAIREVSKGSRYVCDEIKDIMIKQGFSTPFEESQFSLLSKRETEIAECIKKGYSSRDISLHLGITLKTVEAHRYNMLKKLKVRNVASLVNYLNHNVL